MSGGFIDLHSHYVPEVDDGVTSYEDGVALCREMHSLGFEMMVATPHIRAGMFDNQPTQLREAFERFRGAASQEPDMPELGLGCEHHCDSLFWALLERREHMTYPGGHCALMELPNEMLPPRLEQQFFQISLKGLRPVLAHPERYVPLLKRTDPIDPLLQQGVAAQLDIMALTGKYGRKVRKAAERMLDEGAYTIACSDAHRPKDVRDVGKAVDVLFKRAGEEEARTLLAENPRRLLAGEPTL